MALSGKWKELLDPEFKENYMLELKSFLILEDMDGKVIYPPFPRVLEALELCPLEKTKVVIIGQDPYHGPDQAHGLAFSVQPGNSVPPSLQNIYKELESDLGIPAANHGYLKAWAEEGVLLINNVLTVRKGEAGSHKGQGWEQFTSKIISELNKRKENLVFILWGRDAQTKATGVDEKRHLVIRSVHPSPLSAHRGFFGSKPFSKANAYLKEHGHEEIKWSSHCS